LVDGLAWQTTQLAVCMGMLIELIAVLNQS
jgi:hypothetical protein